MIINNNDIIVNGTTVSSTDLVAVSTVTSDIQTQINTKANSANPVFTGNGITIPVLASDPANPVPGQMYYNSNDKVIKHYTGSIWKQLTNKFSATGGTMTQSDGYNYHAFTTSSTFVVETAGEIDYLIVAGGGAGGGSGPGLGGGGGGGAGGMITGSTTLPVGSYTVVIGAGGTAVLRDRGNSGSNSSIFGITATGGGGGGSGLNSGTSYGYNGGSGGGGGYMGYNTVSNYGSGTSGQGSNGAGVQGGSASGGGGGGKGGAGSLNTGSSTGAGGVGGAGVAWVNGTTYAAGGYGGSGTGLDGSVNTGNGGSGMYADSTGKNGGSGIVIIRYLI